MEGAVYDGTQEQPVNEDETNPVLSDEETSTILCRSERTQQCPDYYRTWIY